MPPIPRLSGRGIIRALVRAGWVVDRIRGSHDVLVSPDGRRGVVPVHGAVTLPVGTIEGIIDQTGLTVSEFTPRQDILALPQM